MTRPLEDKIKALGFALPDAPFPVANYVPWLKSDNLIYVSGQISKTSDGTLITGILGKDLDVAAGQSAAEACALNILAQAKAAVGAIENIKQVVKLTGFVAATPEFTEHPQVINGASDLLVNVLGEAGQHTRAAVGVSSLPLGVAVEIDAIIRC